MPSFDGFYHLNFFRRIALIGNYCPASLPFGSEAVNGSAEQAGFLRRVESFLYLCGRKPHYFNEINFFAASRRQKSTGSGGF